MKNRVRCYGEMEYFISNNYLNFPWVTGVETNLMPDDQLIWITYYEALYIVYAIVLVIVGTGL